MNYYNITLTTIKGEEILSLDFINKENSKKIFNTLIESLCKTQSINYSIKNTNIHEIGKYRIKYLVLTVTHQLFNSNSILVYSSFNTPKNIPHGFIYKTIPNGFND